MGGNCGLIYVYFGVGARDAYASTGIFARAVVSAACRFGIYLARIRACRAARACLRGRFAGLPCACLLACMRRCRGSRSGASDLTARNLGTRAPRCTLAAAAILCFTLPPRACGWAIGLSGA
jgi:hypothetical protein